MDNSTLLISEDKLSQIVMAACAYYEQNATQQQIAQELGISRSQVSRYLDKARELGIVSITITQPDAHSVDLESKLKELYPCLRDVIVMPFSSYSHIDRDLLLGRATSNYLMGVLQDGMLLGIGAGRGVQSVVHWLRPTSANIRVVQTMGSTGNFAHSVDYTLLANEAAKRLGAPLSTINAPTVLWKGAGSVESLVAANKQLMEVVEMSRNCNIYLLGVGAIIAEREDLFVKSGLLEEQEFESVRDAGAVGNICASFYRQNGELVETSFEDRIVGVRKEDIRKAQYSIMIGTGPSKVCAMAGALRGGLVNVIATDHQTARQIIELEKR